VLDPLDRIWRLMVLILLIVLIGLGAVAGNIYFKKYPDKVMMPPMPE